MKQKRKNTGQLRSVLDAAAEHADDKEQELLDRAMKMSDEEVERLVLLFPPIDNWVLLRLDVRNKTTGGLWIPGQAAMGKRWCVRAVGPGTLIDSGPRAGERVPVALAVGDYPLLSVHARVAQSDEYPRLGFMKVDPGTVMGIDRRMPVDFEAPRILATSTVLQ